MKSYLFAISIGPVQGFIGAARRTRDFWMGSTILSECVKAAVRWVATQPPASAGNPQIDRLIFPAPVAWEDLQPWELDGSQDPKDDFNATNVMLFHLPAADPGEVVQQVRQEVNAQWQSFVERTLDHRAKGWPHPVRDDLDSHVLATEMAEDIFEVFAAWVPFDPNGGDYQSARSAVMRLLGGRKSTRDFPPWEGVAGKPKSSLDGARESVLKEPSKDPRGRDRRDFRMLPLHIRDAEQLDLIGLVKRLQFGSDALRFPSVSRIAADPWIRNMHADPEGRGALTAIAERCRELVKLNVLRIRRRVADGEPMEADWPKFPWWEQFPFEGTPLFAERRQELLDEARGDANRTAAEGELAKIAQLLTDAAPKFGRPEAYYAIVAADGDRMGQTISRLSVHNDPAYHRALSVALSRFDREVYRYVNGRVEATHGPHKRYHGATVFAGADDVLCLIPVDQCLDCARELYRLFDECLTSELERIDKPLVEAMKAEGTFPTLSAGIAIVHFLDPLEDALHFAKEAEHRAKNPLPHELGRQSSRNGLAVAVHTRGGAPFTIRGNFASPKQDSPTQGSSALPERLRSWIQLHGDGELSSKAAYDLRTLSRSYASVCWSDRSALGTALRADALRVLGRKQGKDSPERKSLEQLLASVQTADDLLAIGCELLAAQWLAGGVEAAVLPDPLSAAPGPAEEGSS